MSNNITLTPKVYARLTLMDLGGSLKVARNMSTAITPEFAKPSYKIGDTVEVRKPYRFAGGDGIGWDPEPLVDQVTAISVKQVSHVHFQMDSVERTLELREAMNLYTSPTALSLGAKINARAATFAANNALNSVGTPGTAPTSEATYLAAGDVLIELGLPDDEELNLVVNRRMSSAFVSGVKSLLNPTGAISAQWRKGAMVDSLGYTVQRDQTINTRTNGTFSGTPLVNGANQTAEGGNNANMTLVTDGWGSGATSLKLGDRFTIGSDSSATVGGVNSTHPQTHQSTGRQQVFTVVADKSDTTGAMSPVIFPAITPTGQYQNVDSSPVDNAIITMIGTSALTNIQQGLLTHRNAFAFVSVPLWNPTKGVIDSQQETDPETGLSISYIQYFDGDGRSAKHRFDCLYDFGNMYREMACVIQA